MFSNAFKRYRKGRKVSLPLLAFIVERWVSINHRRFVIITIAVSRTGLVGIVMPGKYFSSSAISSCQCYCISSCRLRIAQSPPLTAERHLLRQCTHYSLPLPPSWTLSASLPLLDLVRPD